MAFVTTFGEIGIKRGLVRGIEAILRVRFRDAGSQLMPQIRQINDLERLEQILNAAETVASPDDLRKLWTEGPGRQQPQ